MKSIGGNITAEIQIRVTQKNEIGQGVPAWSCVGSVLGWLDFESGQNEMVNFKSKVQDTTHYFLCDYDKYTNATRGANVTSENSRLVIDGEIYQILLIDDPMNLHQHMEIYLQYVGGGLGV